MSLDLRATLALGVAAVLVASTTALAQQAVPRNQPQGQPQAQPGQRQGQQMARGSVDDSLLAACLADDNQGEIAMAQFALQHAESDEVKQFAQQMLQQHQELLARLQPFVAGAGQTPPQPLPQQQQRPEDAQANRGQPAAEAQAQPAGRTQPGQRQPAGVARGQNRQSGQGNEFLSLKREISQTCLQMMQQELGEHQGAEFDKAFMGSQIGAHIHAIAAMRVARNHASPELAQVIDGGIQTAQTHLEHAKQLCKKLQGSQAAASP